MSDVRIAPSILSADFSRLGEEVVSVEKAGCDWIHVDVMDGHFVPNITIGPVVVSGVRASTKLPLDVHLMIEHPERYIRDFAKAGSDYLTIHYEATQDPIALLGQITDAGMKPGISLKPGTPLTSERLELLRRFALVLIMTVEPGFGGQEFMPEMLQKVRQLRPSYQGLIAVDGGINQETGKMAKESGVDVLVAGSYIFKDRDRASAISKLRCA